MSSLTGSNILIVGEAPGTLELRQRLIESGANVHVVSVAGAKLLLQQKQIDTAYIAASLEHDTQELSEELSSLGISQIFITAERVAPLDAAIARGSTSIACAASCIRLPSLRRSSFSRIF